MKRSDSGAKRLQSLYHLCGSKVVSINGIERTGGRTAFKGQGHQVPGIFAPSPEARNFPKSGTVSLFYGYLYDFSCNLA